MPSQYSTICFPIIIFKKYAYVRMLVFIHAHCKLTLYFQCFYDIYHSKLYKLSEDCEDSKNFGE